MRHPRKVMMGHSATQHWTAVSHTVWSVRTLSYSGWILKKISGGAEQRGGNTRNSGPYRSAVSFQFRTGSSAIFLIKPFLWSKPAIGNVHTSYMWVVNFQSTLALIKRQVQLVWEVNSDVWRVMKMGPVGFLCWNWCFCRFWLVWGQTKQKWWGSNFPTRRPPTAGPFHFWTKPGWPHTYLRNQLSYIHNLDAILRIFVDAELVYDPTKVIRRSFDCISVIYYIFSTGFKVLNCGFCVIGP